MADILKEPSEALKDYRILEEIGRGSFGIVFRAERREDGQMVCIKSLDYSSMTSAEKEQLVRGRLRGQRAGEGGKLCCLPGRL